MKICIQWSISIKPLSLNLGEKKTKKKSTVPLSVFMSLTFWDPTSSHIDIVMVFLSLACFVQHGDLVLSHTIRLLHLKGWTTIELERTAKISSNSFIPQRGLSSGNIAWNNGRVNSRVGCVYSFLYSDPSPTKQRVFVHIFLSPSTDQLWT